jgi:Undecaprenyl-phosphate glucose phosphotransferase
MLEVDQSDRYGIVILLGSIGELLWIYRLGLLKSQALLSFRRQLVGIAATWSGVVASLLIIGFLLHVSDSYSRVWVVLWYAISVIGLISSHGFASRLVSRWHAEGRLRRNVVIITSHALSGTALSGLTSSLAAGYHVVAYFSDDDLQPAPPPSIKASSGPVAVQGLNDLPDIVNRYAIDDVIIAVPWTSQTELVDILKPLMMLPVCVRLVPDMPDAILSRLSVSRVGGVTLLEVASRPLDGVAGVLKRIEDLVLVGLILPLVLPMMGIIALSVRLDSSGPVIFRQKRAGFRGTPFEVWKFRTMRVDLQDPTGTRQTTRNDPRVTRLGRFLRKSSLDELPQLLNVIRGDMSVIGPRPHPIGMRAGDLLYDEAVAEYVARYRVKPGITGWAQVNGLRGEIADLESARKRIEHDLHYIENWSIMLDLKILMRTLLIVMSTRNAF